jgi:DNA repair photolyase
MKNKSTKQAFGTREWAKSTINYINGCSNNCKYCYANEMAVRFKRKTQENWAVEEIKHHKLDKKFRKRNGTQMFPSTHDITPNNLKHSIQVLENLLRKDNDVLIVTKPYIEFIKTICEKFKDKKEHILFRFTIGSADNDTLKFWEKNAPSYEERMASLKHAYSMEFQTSVSAEPILDIEIDKLISSLLPYVTDSIWIGKANYLLSRLKRNGFNDDETIQKAKEIIANQSDEWVQNIYNTYKDNPKIEWKDSIKKIMNIPITVNGLDQ